MSVYIVSVQDCNVDGVERIYTYGSSVALHEDFSMSPLQENESAIIYRADRLGDEAQPLDPNDPLYMAIYSTLQGNPS